MSDDRSSLNEHDLNRFWNELVRPTGEPAAGSGALDPATSETVRRLQSLGAMPPPASSRERVRRAVRANIQSGVASDKAPPVNQAGFVDLTRPTAGPNSRNGASPARWSQLPVPAARRRWGFAQLATAALLLLILGLVYFVFGPGRSDHDQPAGIPAGVDPTGTPTPVAMTEETLVLVTLPAGSLPLGDVGAGYGQYVVPPGDRSTWASASDGCCPEFRFTYVLAGVYTVRSQGTVQILRAGGDGTWEMVSPGTEFTLGPGDASITSTETAGEAANLGSEPVEVLFSVVTDGSYGTGSNPGNPVPSGFIEHDGRGGPFTVPDGPVRLQLRLVYLAAGAVFPAPAGAFLSYVNPLENAAGTLEPAAQVGRLDDGSVWNFDRRRGDTIYVLTLEPLGAVATPGVGSPTP
jgi:hypothetical protein